MYTKGDKSSLPSQRCYRNHYYKKLYKLSFKVAPDNKPLKILFTKQIRITKINQY